MGIRHTAKKALILLLACALVFPFAQIHAGAATVLVGDLDFSGNIESADARFALRAALQLETPTKEQIRRLDYFAAGTVTTSTARQTLRFAIGLDSPREILRQLGRIS